MALKGKAIGGGAVARHKLWMPLWTAVSGIILPLGVSAAAELMGTTSSVIGGISRSLGGDPISGNRDSSSFPHLLPSWKHPSPKRQVFLFTLHCFDMSGRGKAKEKGRPSRAAATKGKGKETLAEAKKRKARELGEGRNEKSGHIDSASGTDPDSGKRNEKSNHVDSGPSTDPDSGKMK